MLRRTTFIVCCMMMFATLGCDTQQSSQAPDSVMLNNLLQQTLSSEFTPDREVVVSYVEMPPNTVMDRHWHPGEEFHYYLEGSAEIRIDGHPSILGRPGVVGHVPYRAMHSAITGPEGVRLVVFRVHAAGQPVRIDENENASSSN